ncbi:MAG: hypothetical protein KGH58_00655 [Candidatus Micrarchaeota archaeon]|nr:hypothetical protein [Candidatus Micrarchaeota archaeon]
MENLLLFAGAAIIVVLIGAVLYAFTNGGVPTGVKGSNSANSPVSTASAPSNTSANSVTAIQDTKSSNSAGNASTNSTIATALAACTKAGIPSPQCQSYCKSNPPACGLGSGPGSTSANDSNQSLYRRIDVGQSATISQFKIGLVNITYPEGVATALLNVSQGPYSRSVQIEQRQYVGFGENGTGPYIAVYQINSTVSPGWVTLNVVFAAVAGFSAVGNQQMNTTNSAQGSSVGGSQGLAYMLPTCQNQAYLTAPATNLSSVLNITPLGSLNPQGGHPIPSDHGGWSIANPHDVAATIYAPGDVHVLQIVAQNSTINGQSFQDDAIYFAPCQQLVFYYGHVAHLSDALQQQVNNASKSAYCQHSVQPAGTSTTCTYSLNYVISAGKVLGSAGGPGTSILGFDFGGYDYRTIAPAFIDPTREMNDFGRPVNVIFPLDYYSASMQGVLYPLVKDTLKGSNGYPSEWTNMQDLAGTVQGNWYLNGSSSTGEANWSQQMSIVHYYENPSIGVISVGGVLAQASMITFNPRSEGYVNREPSQVTADGHVYCYYQDNWNTSYGLSPLSGYFELQLISANVLRIQYQDGSCPQDPTFTNATEYIR